LGSPHATTDSFEKDPKSEAGYSDSDHRFQ
jgi:hypothetical protein